MLATALPTPSRRRRSDVRRPPAARRRPLGLLLLVVLAGLASARSASAQLRVVSWNVAGLAGDTDAIRDVLGFLATDDLSGFAVAPHLIVLQEVEQGNQNAMLALATQAVPEADYALATYTNAGEDGSGGAQALIYRADRLAEIPTGHRDLLTGAGRRADRWELRWLDADAGEGTLWLYSAHLKASPGADNEAQRLAGAQVLRDDIATRPAGSNVLLVGDLNLYSNLEPAYAELLEGGPNPLLDPLGTGSWSGPANAIVHTQSPRATGFGGLVGGGLDDRFDFLLPAVALDDGAGLAILADTYRSVGNDGNHFNQSINAGTNTYWPDDIPASNALADALFVASDHLPVLLDLQVPAVLETSLPADLGRLVLGAGLLVPATFENAADVADASATDPLFISWTATGDLLGGGTALANPLAGPQPIPAALAASRVGPVSGTIELSTADEGVADPVRSLVTSALVVRPSEPSLDADAPATEGEIELTVTAGGPPVDVDVPVFNLGWDELQSRLDLDGVAGLAGGLALDGPLATGIEASGTVPLRFDPAGLGPGVIEVPISIATSDEDVPGETTAALDLLVRVTITETTDPLDLDGDGVVAFGDLLVLLSDFGSCPAPPADCPADLDGSGAVDFGDLLELLGALG